MKKSLEELIINSIPPSGFSAQAARVSNLSVGDIVEGLFAPSFTAYYPFEINPVIVLFKPDYGYFYLHNDHFFDSARLTLSRALEAERFEDVPEIRDYHALQKDVLKTYTAFHPMHLKKNATGDLLVMMRDVTKITSLLWCLTLHLEAADENIFLEAYTNIQGTKEGFIEFLERASTPMFKTYESIAHELLATYNGGDPYPLQWLVTDYYFAPKIEDTPALLTKERAHHERDAKKDSMGEQNARFETWAHTLPVALQKLARYIQEVVKLRDLRREHVKRLVALKSNAIRALAHNLPIEEHLLPFVSVHDFHEGRYLSTDFPKELEKRSRGYLMIFTSAQPEIHYVDYREALTVVETAVHQGGGHTKDVRVQGSIAYRGIARGTVRRIETKEEFSKFQAGDVLVTSMTRIEFVPLMKQAAAIITNEGGITSHAAIVSRELKKPCIIGTKNATHVLKDGDFVEVDAEKGIVTVIS